MRSFVLFCVFFYRSKVSPSSTSCSAIQADPLLLPATINDESPSKFSLNWSAGSQIRFDPGSNQVFTRDLSATIVREETPEVGEVILPKLSKLSNASFAQTSKFVQMSNVKKKIYLRKARAKKSALRLEQGNSFSLVMVCMFLIVVSCN